MNFLIILIVVLFFGFDFSVTASTFHAEFNNASLQDFALTAGKVMGENVVIDTKLTGAVTLQSQDLSSDDYHTLFLSVMRSYGYAVQESDNTLTIHDGSHILSGIGQLVTSKNQDTNTNVVITRVLSLSHISAAELVGSLKDTLSGEHDVRVTAVGSTNLLIITGYADSVDKIQMLAKRADNEQSLRQISIPLDYAVAKPLAAELQQITRSGGQNSAHVDVTADTRTNSIIVSGKDDDLTKMKALIQNLDVPADSDDSSGDDANGDVVYLKYAQAKDVADVLQKVLAADKDSESTVVPDEKVNAVVINSYGDEESKLRNLITKLDIRRAQVHVEAMIVELTDADGINFGVQWGSKDGGLMQFSNGSQIPLGALAGAVYEAQPDKGSTVIDENGNTTVNPDEKGDVSELLSLLSGYNGAAITIQQGNWMALVQALKSNSAARILSTPSLTTLDNQKASFLVGEEVPVITGSTTSSTNSNPFQTVDRKNVGTRLTITPQINSGDAVQLTLSAEISKVEGSTGVDVVFAERKLDTTVLADSGSMIVLGGLLDEQQDTSSSEVPFLGEIPLLGKLFRSDSNSSQKRNLMIFIRPTIIRTPDDAATLSEDKYRYIHIQELYNQMFGRDESADANHAEPGIDENEIDAFHNT
ncbi:secretin N-terminal domain-containing protein [Klebsiella aerogenes]|uniref:secretin N-terminal domain-containing protein n=1 Tax=Klebsiella aerogenes TaxID=548 RepID=UPI0007B37550|nr:secretin N-terminal domain-containing protein [Klebsiella aerogenes]EKZ5855720.1 type II secretion system protein GspD [Klebsiella aerogenes]EKZ6548481.1 type II secretion system protein GspD [Klebsiella aerogenes]EKZ6676758.1 type II secretion system protein GspD [Klebsiella aerogenes]KZR11301.1 hypothetical protein A3N65_12455 [Klebsiella aerogenes]